MEKKIALISGANKGIGFATAALFLKKDIIVLLGSRDPKKGEAAKEKLRSPDAHVLPLDVDDKGSVDKAKEWVVAKFNRLDILINNAAVYLDGDHKLKDMPIADFETTIRTNLFGPLYLTQAFLPLMEKNKYGRVVNISSGYGSQASMSAGVGSYKTSKLALNGMTRILADEVDAKIIKINAICPGWVRTDMGGSDATRSPAEAAKGLYWAATLPDDGPTGGYFRDGKSIDW